MIIDKIDGYDFFFFYHTKKEKKRKERIKKKKIIIGDDLGNQPEYHFIEFNFVLPFKIYIYNFLLAGKIVWKVGGLGELP